MLTEPVVQYFDFVSHDVSLLQSRLNDSQVHGCEVKVAQSCPTLCDPMDYTFHGILQARILEWVPFPSPGDLPNPDIEPRSPTLQADFLPAEPQGKSRRKQRSGLQ